MSFSKKSFAVILSKLEVFENPKATLEQYPTDPEVAADFLWNAALNGEIKDKTIADLGAGTGLLGIGALLLGAKKVIFVEKDAHALMIAKRNHKEIESEYDIGEAEFQCMDVSEFNDKVDVVIENPPFGVKDEHADRNFLMKAFGLAEMIYSLHKIESKTFLEKLSKDNGFLLKNVYSYKFLLKNTMKFHRKKNERIDVIGVRLVKT